MSLCWVSIPNNLYLPLSCLHIIPLLFPLAASGLFSVSVHLLLFRYILSFVVFSWFHIYKWYKWLIDSIYISDTVQHWPFSVWLISLSIMPSSPSTLLQMAKRCSFIWPSHTKVIPFIYNESYSTIYIYYILYISSLPIHLLMDT